MPGARLREPRPTRASREENKSCCLPRKQRKENRGPAAPEEAPGGGAQPLWLLERGEVGSGGSARLPVPLGVPDPEACEGLEPRPLLWDATLSQ